MSLQSKRKLNEFYRMSRDSSEGKSKMGEDLIQVLDIMKEILTSPLGSPESKREFYETCRKLNKPIPKNLNQLLLTTRLESMKEIIELGSSGSSTPLFSIKVGDTKKDQMTQTTDEDSKRTEKAEEVRGHLRKWLSGQRDKETQTDQKSETKEDLKRRLLDFDLDEYFLKRKRKKKS